MATSNVIGHDIRARRIALRATQDDLAWAVGLERSYISKIELGLHAPSLEIVSRIADVLYMPALKEAVDEVDQFRLRSL